MNETPAVPVDDAALNAIEHALDGAYEVVDGCGNVVLRGADYTLDQLLGLWAGIDPTEQGEYVGHGDPLGVGMDAPVYEMPGVYLTERDIIRALIAEVRRLRDGGAAAKALRDAATSLRTEAATVWGGDASWLTTGSKAANLAADWVSAIAENLTDSEDWK